MYGLACFVVFYVLFFAVLGGAIGGILPATTLELKVGIFACK